MRPTHVAIPFLLALPVCAQANAVPGTDIRVYDVGSPTVYGRRGPAYPNGEAGVGIGHSYCNGGTVHLPWLGTSGGVMIDTYPKIAFLLARESNGRMVQISGESFLKHSRVAFNFSSGPCAPCQTGPSSTMRIGCSDTYSTGFNGDRYNLGPTEEIDPWLGTWNSQGSYFDRGDPAVTGAAAMDRVQSLTSTQVLAFDAVKNRMTVRESDLAAAGTFHGQVHLMIQGEPVGNRGNNLMSRRLTFAWNGSSWTTSAPGASVQGSVLTQWTGASTAMAGNGSDDGRFLVACKVTGPVGGFWHYEYAVHNLDNARGGASLRIPLCDGARVGNVGFRDVDNDPLNEWSTGRTASELEFLAAANNALDWNCIYNFWFDSDSAPVSGTVVIDEARLGAGALMVNVAAQVPGQLGSVHLGDGCGTPTPALYANGLPNVPNAGYALRLETLPGAGAFFVFGWAGASLPVGGTCTQFVDGTQLAASVYGVADGTGLATWNLPIPSGLLPLDLYAQALVLVTGGPLFGQASLSNGLLLRIGALGCP